MRRRSVLGHVEGSSAPVAGFGEELSDRVDSALHVQKKERCMLSQAPVPFPLDLVIQLIAGAFVGKSLIAVLVLEDVGGRLP